MFRFFDGIFTLLYNHKHGVHKASIANIVFSLAVTRWELKLSKTSKKNNDSSAFTYFDLSNW